MVSFLVSNLHHFKIDFHQFSTKAELIIMVINAVTGNPILGVDVCYSCPELNIQACAATDSEGKLDAGKYPVNSLFNVTCSMEGYDSREDIIEVQADENVIPLNPKVSFWILCF